jgi:hypothetical protein
MTIVKNNLLYHWEKTRNMDAPKFYLVFKHLAMIAFADMIILLSINAICLFKTSHNTKMLFLLIILLSFFMIIISLFFVVHNLLLCDYDPFLYLFEFADDNINAIDADKHLNKLLKLYIMQQLPIERSGFLLTYCTTNSILFFAVIGLIITFMEIVSLCPCPEVLSGDSKPEADIEN